MILDEWTTKAVISLLENTEAQDQVIKSIIAVLADFGRHGTVGIGTLADLLETAKAWSENNQRQAVVWASFMERVEME